MPPGIYFYHDYHDYHDYPSLPIIHVLKPELMATALSIKAALISTTASNMSTKLHAPGKFGLLTCQINTE